MSRNRQAGGFEPLFDPASIAVVGASNTPGKMGNLFMRRLAARFRGRLYAVNPKDQDLESLRVMEAAGLPCYRSTDAAVAAVGATATGEGG